MKKLIVVFSLFISSIAISHNPFQSPFFHHGMGDNFWRDFDRQFQRLEHEMNRIKHNSNSFSSQSKQYFDKQTNAYIVAIKINGLDKDDLEINAEKNMLIVKGSKSVENNKHNSRSRSSNSFVHSTSIPKDGDIDNISADFKNGVLKVSIPKLDEPKTDRHQIEIN